METVEFKARDNTRLAGSFWKGTGPSVILLHQYNKDRHSWDRFASKLNEQGYTVLSFDFRGFGESDLDKDIFDVNDFLSLVSDVKAARRFLESNGANTDRIFIIGASIGANTAMNYAPIDTSVDGVVLISPGLDYRGIKIEDSAKIYQEALLLVASENDRESKEAVDKINEITDATNKKVKLYPNSAHGTDLFNGTDLEDVIISWLKSI